MRSYSLRTMRRVISAIRSETAGAGAIILSETVKDSAVSWIFLPVNMGSRGVLYLSCGDLAD